MKLQKFIILKLSINSSDKGIVKDLYRDKKSLKIKTNVTHVINDDLISKVIEGLIYNSSEDILFRHKEIISICHTLKTSGQYSVFYAKMAVMQIATTVNSAKCI